jgi:hypothetical protein
MGEEIRIYALPMSVEELELEGETCFVVVDAEGQELGDDTGAVYYLQRHVAEASAQACAVMRQIAECPCGWRGTYDDSRARCPSCLQPSRHCTDTWVVLDVDDWGAGEPEWTDGRVDDCDDGQDDYASLVDYDYLPVLEVDLIPWFHEVEENCDGTLQLALDPWEDLALDVAHHLGCEASPVGILTSLSRVIVHRERLIRLARLAEPQLGGELGRLAHQLIEERQVVELSQADLMRARGVLIHGLGWTVEHEPEVVHMDTVVLASLVVDLLKQARYELKVARSTAERCYLRAEALQARHVADLAQLRAVLDRESAAAQLLTAPVDPPAYGGGR